MLEERLNELGSAIINYKEDNIELIGFYSPEMLLFQNETLDNKLSHGIYPFEDINHSKIKDNFILVVQENSKEIIRYKFKTREKLQLTYKDHNGNNKSRLFRVRVCEYTNLYNYVDTEESKLLEFYDDIHTYLNSKYELISINRF